ncbi:MAG: hypothetical protein M3R27_05995 [Bacteroidota bacterium]|nr:hypothetical protein [Bacteroidota bacterium]
MVRFYSPCYLLSGFIFWLAFLTPTSSNSQIYNFTNYSLEDGLSQSEVNCIYEDSRGYLWLGTSGGGLCRFDGKIFKTFEEKDGLCGQIISSVSEDNNHDILIGTKFNELCKFDGQEFSKLEYNQKKFGDGDIKFICTDDNMNTIVGKSTQILLYSNRKFESLNLKGDTLKDFKVNCFKKDSRNIIWIGTNKGLFVLKNKTLVRISDVDLIHNKNITSLSEDINGNIWAVENKTGFFKIKIVGPSHYQVKASRIDSIPIPGKTIISDIHFDLQNQLWIATENKGIFKFASGEISSFSQENGLPVDNIITIYEDKSGNLWFGTSGGGLVKFTNQAFTYFDNVQGFNQPDIFAINSDRKGNIWIGTSLHGVYKYDGKKVTAFTTGPLGETETRCIFTDKKGNTWIGTTKGIWIHNGSTLRPYKEEGCENIRAIFEDKSGNIWIGTKGNGVFIDDGKSVKNLNLKDGLTNLNVYSIVQHKDGSVWLGTGNGLFAYTDGKITKHLRDGLCNAYAGSMVIGKFGNIWVGTDKCVSWYDGTKFTNISTNEGLTSGTVYLINTDNYGNIWVGTNKGLDRISLTGKADVESIQNYGKAEGFKGIECNSRATCIDEDGCLWFGTIKGAIKFNPKEELLRQPEIPQVQITGIKLFYENTKWDTYTDTLSHWYHIPKGMDLPHNKNHLTFYFSAISKAFPEHIQYRFKLEGFDKEWSPVDEIASATYSNLPPGNYKFIVRAVNKIGIENPIASEVSFTIKAPFWTTWWFLLLCLLGFAGFIYGYNQYRKRKHILFKERLEMIIKQRTTEVIKQRDENVILLKEVHHRVKNNLQIINSLINIQSDYISDPKASELFREIRNRIRTISLVHEKLYKSDDFGNINVKEYINMLVENLIDTYSINKYIQLKLDLEVQHFNLNTIIPLGLLLNEIISNSFKYAFNDVDQGVIEISLYKSSTNEDYTVIIGDNGQGFRDELFLAESPTLGLELVRILATQLNGSIEKINKPGTYYILKFKPLKD